MSKKGFLRRTFSRFVARLSSKPAEVFDGTEDHVCVGTHAATPGTAKRDALAAVKKDGWIINTKREMTVWNKPEYGYSIIVDVPITNPPRLVVNEKTGERHIER